MILDTDIRLERLRRLPATGATWLLALERFPTWKTDGPGAPFRPRLMLCLDPSTDTLEASDPVLPGDDVESAALEVLLRLSRQRSVAGRPARLEVEDGALAEALRPRLGRLDIECLVVPRLQGLERARQGLREHLGGPMAMRGMYVSPDLEVERVRAFAEAAAAFDRAAPWNELENEDLLRIDSPVPARMHRWFSVMGAGGLEYGLGFYEDAEVFRRILEDDDPDALDLDRGLWNLSFDPPHDLPIPDSELWEAHDLPLTGARCCPALRRMTLTDAFETLAPEEVTFAEGLLRALAQTTEDDLDAGRWTRTVSTFDGPRTVELCLPDLLDAERRPLGDRTPHPMFRPDRRGTESVLRDVQALIASREFASPEELNRFLSTQVGRRPEHRPAVTPRQQAEDLVSEAWDWMGRRRLQLARRALALWPDCADALVIRAEAMPERERRLRLWREAVEAGRRALGPEVFARDAGHFWDVLETRPFMRAMEGLASALWEGHDPAGRDEAADLALELLRLDPGDHLGIRFPLIAALLEDQATARALEVLDRFHDDPSASLAYARVLAVFQMEGPGGFAEGELVAARRANPHVVKFLVGRPSVGEPAESFEPGSEEEAEWVYEELGPAWRATPGALDWLRGRRRADKRERRKGPAARRRR